MKKMEKITIQVFFQMKFLVSEDNPSNWIWLGNRS